MPDLAAAGTCVRPEAAICRETARVSTALYGDRLRAIVLTGSLARDEATVVRRDPGWKLLGDADFYLVFGDGAEEPAPASLRAAAGEIESALLAAGVAAEIGLSAVDGKYLATMPRHILTYELRRCGRVIHGDRQILALVPEFGARDIAREDAWRLLANRIVEQVGNADPARARYGTVKLCLDMATSYLVFAGCYEPSYRERERRLRKLAADGAPATLPLELFADQVSLCTRFKLDGADLEDDEWAEVRETVLELARRLWGWELAQLTGDAGDEAALMARWMETQPLRARLRGWGSVMRRTGWLRGWRDWPRWGRLGRKASPRYWVYSVAAEMFFDPAGAGARARALAKRLPLCGKAAGDGACWQSLARLTAANYREFVETTTA